MKEESSVRQGKTDGPLTSSILTQQCQEICNQQKNNTRTRNNTSHKNSNDSYIRLCFCFNPFQGWAEFIQCVGSLLLIDRHWHRSRWVTAASVCLYCTGWKICWASVQELSWSDSGTNKPRRSSQGPQQDSCSHTQLHPTPSPEQSEHKIYTTYKIMKMWNM